MIGLTFRFLSAQNRSNVKFLRDFGAKLCYFTPPTNSLGTLVDYMLWWVYMRVSKPVYSLYYVNYKSSCFRMHPLLSQNWMGSNIQKLPLPQECEGGGGAQENTTILLRRPNKFAGILDPSANILLEIQQYANISQKTRLPHVLSNPCEIYIVANYKLSITKSWFKDSFPSTHNP